MKEAASNMVCIACGVFRAELDALQTRGDINFPVQYLDSMLHMHPQKLHKRLESTIGLARETDVIDARISSDTRAPNGEPGLLEGSQNKQPTTFADMKKTLLLYGDCHAFMSDQESLPGVYRVRGRNCAEILLGPDLYRTLWNENAFIFLPEWTPRWHEIFQQELGLSGELTQDLMKDSHTKLTYADTEVIPVPTESLQEASDAMGLPWEVIRVGKDPLLAAIQEAVERMSVHVA